MNWVVIESEKGAVKKRIKVAKARAWGGGREEEVIHKKGEPGKKNPCHLPSKHKSVISLGYLDLPSKRTRQGKGRRHTHTPLLYIHRYILDG